MEVETEQLHAAVLAWYEAHRRWLPWRAGGVDGWQVLVSEVMLQQTPVSRVLPVYEQWMARWPTPAALAADGAGEAIRMWGRLGYPRRALRLHAAAVMIEQRHQGNVPGAFDDLRALPGVGEYTAAAVCAFAYRQRQVVLDTNVRRVLARVRFGVQHPSPSVTNRERDAARELLPHDPAEAATWSVGLMELGALVCTATTPACERCPAGHACRWRAAGWPPQSGRRPRSQAYAGTDRQCRGTILAVLRGSDRPVAVAAVESVWSNTRQRERALTSLVDDGLVVWADEGRLALP
ncbi:MAG: A/G-specific adenine glycosylase [Nocardioidaceae bacterium]